MMEDRKKEDGARAATLAVLARGTGAAPQSGFAMFQAFMTSVPVVASTVMAAAVISAIGWQDIAKRAAEDDSYLAKSSVEAKIRTHPAHYNLGLVEGLPGASQSGPNALEMFRQTNRDGVREDIRKVSQERSINEAYEETAEETAELNQAASVETPEAAALRAMDPFKGEKSDEKKKESHKKETKKLAKAFVRPKISGGVGMSGGSGGGFDLKMKSPPPAATQGQARAMSQGRTQSITRGKTGIGAGHGGSKLRGATGKKLSRMNRAMSATKGSGAATTASSHNSQWDGSGNIGSGISGAGASGNAISGGGQALETGGLSGGGPLNAGGSNASSPGEESAPSVGKGKNVTPNQKMIDTAMILLPIASVLLLASYVLGKNPATKGAAKGLAYGAAAVSAVIAGIGVMVLAKGQTNQGGLLAAVGGALGFISYTAAEGNEDAAAGDKVAKDEAIQWAGPDDPGAGTSNLA